MMVEPQFIEQDGEPVYAVVPIDEWNRLVGRLEEMADELAGMEALAERGAEGYPIEVIEALDRGESPVRVWRHHRGLTQTQLADAAGLSAAYVAQLESGTRKGSTDALRRLARALRVDLDLLVWPSD